MILLLIGVLKIYLSLLMQKYVQINFRYGQAALSMILLIGGIISLIVITLIVMISSYSSYAFYNTLKALAAANSGIDDALMRIVRDKSFSAPNGYTINIDGIEISVVVEQSVNGKVIIISSATFLSYNSKIKAIVSLDDNGEVRLISRRRIK